jgi:hypothetical protein
VYHGAEFLDIIAAVRSALPAVQQKRAAAERARVGQLLAVQQAESDAAAEAAAKAAAADKAAASRAAAATAAATELEERVADARARRAADLAELAANVAKSAAVAEARRVHLHKWGPLDCTKFGFTCRAIEHRNTKAVAGARVSAVTEGSPADYFGLKVGDVLVDVNYRRVISSAAGKVMKLCNRVRLRSFCVGVPVWACLLCFLLCLSAWYVCVGVLVRTDVCWLVCSKQREVVHGNGCFCWRRWMFAHCLIRLMVLNRTGKTTTREEKK